MSEAYNIFHEHCVHRGWCRGESEDHPAQWMCSFANKETARCWEDWIECTEAKCSLIKSVKEQK